MIEKALIDFPLRKKVANFLLENGFRVENGKIYCNQVQLPVASIARAVDVDRRTVRDAIKTIEEHSDLKPIFLRMRNAGLLIEEIAKYEDSQVIQIKAFNAREPGILAGVASIIAEAGISIRQAVADDPELTPEPRLTIVTNKKIPGELIDKFLKVKGVAKVSIS